MNDKIFKMKTTLKFYTGLDTIGAVILEIKYGNDRVLLEAGTAFNPAFDMFDNRVSKRNLNLINDYLWVNELPQIDYIYRSVDLNHSKLKSAELYNGKQAFFITHLHLDHMRMMGMISPLVPVYLTKGAQTIEKALEDINMGVDHIRDNYFDIPTDIQIGEIKVHKFILNDDSYQDLSFYIETPDLKLHYTGDIFVYGKYFANIQNEIKYINDKNIDILVPEGTTFWSNIDQNIEVYPTFSPLNLLSKSEMDNRLTNMINDYNGLVLFNIYEREMSDVMDIEKYGTKANRIIVYEPKQAYIINKFFNKAINIYIPDTYFEENEWFKYVKEFNHIIDKKDIIANPKQYLVQTTYENILEIIDYKDIKTLYLHISGTPIGAFDPKFKRMMSLIDEFKFDYHNRTDFEDGMMFSCHATREQLLAYLEAVKCKLIIPTHSANRKAYIHNIKKPYYYANLNETYTYNKEKNSLEVIDNE